MNDGISLPDSFPVRFFRSATGREPVREWLKTLGRPDSLVIGEDIRLVQLSWPVGLPVCRPMGGGLYEVRSALPSGRISRILFCFHDSTIVLLHGFIKKTNKTPISDLKLAEERQANILRNKGA
jgi:phage-related protein